MVCLLYKGEGEILNLVASGQAIDINAVGGSVEENRCGIALTELNRRPFIEVRITSLLEMLGRQNKTKLTHWLLWALSYQFKIPELSNSAEPGCENP